MLIGSDFHLRVCGLCAEICDACAQDCKKLANGDELMRRCAESFRKMATTMVQKNVRAHSYEKSLPV